MVGVSAKDEGTTATAAPSRGSGAIRLRVRGQIQGVGFRPFVHRLAHDLGVTGTVRNDPAGVTAEVWGPRRHLDEFERRIVSDAPPPARVVEVVRQQPPDPDSPPADFRIVASERGPVARGRVTVDSATCLDCLAEMSDPHDRRHRHGLVNCTGCGPRYTIVRELPYDRPLTTMAGFSMCPKCAAEYVDPVDRRFHAQPVCCPECGPRVELRRADGKAVPGDPYAETARLVGAGAIVAVKGLGGFHLVVDATNPDAVARLRRRKRRDHKPFAVMARDLAEARSLVRLSPDAEELLTSPAAPVVIAPRRRSGRRELVDRLVAPGLGRLGVMLPGTPMQHLLAQAVGRPLVMTSGNVSEEPLVKDDGQAWVRLGGIADAFLTHDRLIERAVDDSVFVDAASWGRTSSDRPSEDCHGVCAPIPIRRARGFVPAPIRIPRTAPASGICMGADLKNTVAVVRGDEVTLSQHVGDLDHPLAHERFVRTLADLRRLFDVTPAWVAVDLHPRYLSRRHGVGEARKGGLELIEVQHHHAHLASLLVEHGRTGPIVSLVCDGVGYGTDGGAWGGEVLVGDLDGFERAGHMRPLRLPGGDAAARRVGRCAFSWMVDALGPERTAAHDMGRRVLADDAERAAVLSMLQRDLNCPPSSGTGRLFDAAASLLGLCQLNHHEAMSGQLLEAAASRCDGRAGGSGCIPLSDGLPFQMDTRPLLLEILQGREDGRTVEELAWRFHDALADGLARGACRAADTYGLDTVGLTGGVFSNALLTRLVFRHLDDAGLAVLTHHEVPPGDGGIALGQAAVAAAQMRRDCGREG